MSGLGDFMSGGGLLGLIGRKTQGDDSDDGTPTPDQHSGQAMLNEMYGGPSQCATCGNSFLPDATEDDASMPPPEDSDSSNPPPESSGSSPAAAAQGPKKRIVPDMQVGSGTVRTY